MGTLFGPVSGVTIKLLQDVEIPSLMGTLFGLGRRYPRRQRRLVEIPSLMGTLFGRAVGVLLIDYKLRRNTLADGHPIRTQAAIGVDYPFYRRNTLADGHPIRTERR